MASELMTLAELKARLGIADATSDEQLQIALDDTIDYVCNWCGDDFPNGMPSGVKRAVAMLVDSLNDNDSNVASFTIGDMSKSFFQGQLPTEAKGYLIPYRKVRYP